jgi:C4-dicarboxylate transporter, DctQ subunit
MGKNLANSWHTAGRILAGLRLAGFLFARFALAAIVIAYSYEVVSRYLFNAPTWWSAELVSYLLCVMVFTIMPHVTATRGHIAVTVLLETLGPARRLFIERGIAFIGFGICAAVTVFAVDEVSRQIVRNIQMMAIQPIPKWWISIWIIFGFGLSALEFLRLAFGASPPATMQSLTPEI